MTRSFQSIPFNLKQKHIGYLNIKMETRKTKIILLDNSKPERLSYDLKCHKKYCAHPQYDEYIYTTVHNDEWKPSLARATEYRIQLARVARHTGTGQPNPKRKGC